MPSRGGLPTAACASSRYFPIALCALLAAHAVRTFDAALNAPWLSYPKSARGAPRRVGCDQQIKQLLHRADA